MPKVREIMTKNVVSIGLQNSIFEAAELMASKGLGCLVIMDGELLMGIVTERDIVRRAVAKRVPLDSRISEIMSKGVFAVDPDASVKDAARLMSSNKIRRLPVLKQNKLVGIIVAADIVRNLGKKTIPEEILEALGRARGRYPDSSFS